MSLLYASGKFSVCTCIEGEKKPAICSFPSLGQVVSDVRTSAPSLYFFICNYEGETPAKTVKSLSRVLLLRKHVVLRARSLDLPVQGV